MFAEADSLLQGLWIIAGVTTIIFLIQAVLTFMGVDASDGLNADFNADFTDGDASFQLFSFRNLINFLLGFSWTGVVFYGVIDNVVLLLILSFGVGLGFVGIFWVIIKQLVKLSEDNSFNIQKTVGLTGDVYITIPGQRRGKGKVQISVQGAFHELDAITEFQTLASGTPVKVVRLEKQRILVVEPL
jgi:hypothetical protein